MLYSCFEAEIKINNPDYLKKNVQIEFSNQRYGGLIVFNNEMKIVGFMIFNQDYNDLIIIENVCFDKSIRGNGYFKIIFAKFLESIEKYNFNNKRIGLFVWQDNPFNKNHKIEKIYQKFCFNFEK